MYILKSTPKISIFQKLPEVTPKKEPKNILKSTEKYIIKSLHHNVHSTVPVTTTASTRPEARALSLTEQRHGWQQLDWRGGEPRNIGTVSFHHDFNDIGGTRYQIIYHPLFMKLELIALIS